ncbi:MAG: hypothetical protein JOS17DRAFT_122778 [Linnemannia elongata]|nr:MAG: hypothetical protein JOS17DRAFT_122778 [Linnemannia elongata]
MASSLPLFLLPSTNNQGGGSEKCGLNGMGASWVLFEPRSRFSFLPPSPSSFSSLPILPLACLCPLTIHPISLSLSLLPVLNPPLFLPSLSLSLPSPTQPSLNFSFAFALLLYLSDSLLSLFQYLSRYKCTKESIACPDIHFLHSSSRLNMTPSVPNPQGQPKKKTTTNKNEKRKCIHSTNTKGSLMAELWVVGHLGMLRAPSPPPPQENIDRVEKPTALQSIRDEPLSQKKQQKYEK